MASTTAKSEKSRNSSGSRIRPSCSSVVLSEPVAAEERDPRDHADDVGGQERDGADQEQHRLPGRRADMEGEEIGDGEADQQGQRPDDDGELERLQVGPPGDRREQQLLVVLQQEGRDDLGGVVVEEAHHDDA